MQTIGSPLFWTVFLVGVAAILALDLGVLNRKAHAVRPREAALWTAFCVTLAGLFALWIGWRFGARPALEFTTGYLIEYALSVDNLFVFLVVFSYFRVPPQFQHRVLFWGILGALFLRAFFILTGAALLARFHWMIYLFGAFLVVTGVKLLVSGEGEVDPENNPMLRLARRFLRVTPRYHGQRFFVLEQGKRFATPLFLVLIVIEGTDVVFAVDSIPAIFGVTQDPFIVFTSNIFAILGLRSLYFTLAGLMERFRHVKHALVFVLAFVGLKMMLSHHVKIPDLLSLGLIAGALGLGVLASLRAPAKEP